MSRTRRKMTLFMDFPAAVLAGIERFCSSSVRHAAAVSCPRDPQYRTGWGFCFKFIASSGSVQICFSQLDMLWFIPGVRVSAVRTTRNSLRLVWYTPNTNRLPAGKSRAFVSNLHGEGRKLPAGFKAFNAWTAHCYARYTATKMIQNTYRAVPFLWAMLKYLSNVKFIYIYIYM
jgi:hypothetical protein